MSVFENTYKRFIDNEGGYAPPAGPSGETYKGIDRGQNKTWNGWALVDAYKAKVGAIIRNFIIPGAEIENAVFAWYRDYYFKQVVDTTKIGNQTLADMVGDFIVHKLYDAIAVINTTALQLYSVDTNAYKITDAVIALMNNRTSEFYFQLKRNRILYYQNPQQFSGTKLKGFSATMAQAFVNRVNTFPTSV